MYGSMDTDTAQLEDAIQQLEHCMATILKLEGRLAGWHSVCAAARLLDMGAHNLARSESPKVVARIIILAAQAEQLIERDMPGRLVP